jgi:plastocyanin
MSTKAFVGLLSIVACASCAEAKPYAPPPTVPAPVVPTRTDAVTAPQPSGRGSIAGIVATNPWHAIKAGAVVWLEDAPRGTEVPVSITLDNHDMAFVPMIAVVEVGGSVLFTNTDPLMHNVFTPDGDRWNLGEIAQNATVVKRFDTPATYTILCNLHPHMLAYLVVTPSKHFAKTDLSGTYAIPDVPAGTYRVTAWAPRLQPQTQSVTVTSGEATANFSLGR